MILFTSIALMRCIFEIKWDNKGRKKFMSFVIIRNAYTIKKILYYLGCFSNRLGLHQRFVSLKRFVVFNTKFIGRDICARVFSAADRCFPRARLQSPRENHSAGSSDTCCSRWSQRSSASNNHYNSELAVLVFIYLLSIRHDKRQGESGYD